MALARRELLHGRRSERAHQAWLRLGLSRTQAKRAEATLPARPHSRAKVKEEGVAIAARHLADRACGLPRRRVLQKLRLPNVDGGIGVASTSNLWSSSNPSVL